METGSLMFPLMSAFLALYCLFADTCDRFLVLSVSLFFRLPSSILHQRTCQNIYKEVVRYDIGRVEWQLAPRSRSRCVFVRRVYFPPHGRTHDYVRTSHCQCQHMGPIANDRSYQLRIMNNFFCRVRAASYFIYKKQRFYHA